MEAKAWRDLDTRQWRFGALVIAGPSLIAALSTGRENIAIIAAGVVIWAVGKWIQHRCQQFCKDGSPGNRYTRIWSVVGTILDIAGIGLVALGIYGIWKFGEPIF